MNYVKTDGADSVVKYPYTFADLRKDNPNTSFPQNFTLDDMENVFPVLVDPKPSIDASTQYVTMNAPQEISGQWRVTWTVTDYTAQELEGQAQAEADQMTAGSERDKALAMLIADIWQALNTGNVPNQNPNMTQAEARQMVRSRLEAHLRTLKGL